jgi:hypothetical protein
MTRITLAHLQALCDRINTTQRQPLEPYTRDTNNHLIAMPGVYHLDNQNNAWALRRMVSPSGGSSEPLGIGYLSKPVLALVLRAYLAGLNDAGK